MQARLTRFRVINFRSIKDSEWIDTETLTCLVGTNESGKTNLLVGLWKLNPANEEPIDPLIDYPRKKYVDYRATNGNEVFIIADFELSESTAGNLASKLGFHKSLLKSVRISRRYNGSYVYEFPSSQLDKLPSSELIELLSKTIASFNQSDLVDKEDNETIKTIDGFLTSVLEEVSQKDLLDKNEVYAFEDKIDNFLLENYKRKININTFFNENVKPAIKKLEGVFEQNGIVCTPDCEKIIQKALPSFVYYSDYGNLDSEIYLPHVIQNMARQDLGERERAKSRSLKVLFEFVKLQPKEILELGQETPQNANAQTIEAEREKKKKREILLQSASNKLTDEFRGWWKQGNYRFRFQADGNHFRIWVSDDLRTEEVELEGRSRGLQWFFSFFLVFLVESKDAHSNCILLLDEPGLSLHPLAQYDLIKFFETISTDNQLLYTTHSPFLVNPNDLGNVKALYIGDDGSSIVSADLRANEKVAEKSIYPIHAAIGLTVSDTLLLGCIPVLVEGSSDQIYLQLIKNFLIGTAKFKIGKELVFIPTGGVKGMSPVIKLLLGRENELPPVIIDSDKIGKDKIKQLRDAAYKNEPNKIIEVSHILGEGDYEIEDLLPADELSRVFSKKYRGNTTDDFEYTYNSAKPIVNQMEEFAKVNGYTLELGWKVELAKEFQRIFNKISSKLPEDLLCKWVNLFEKIN